MSVVALLLGIPRKGTRISRTMFQGNKEILASILLDATLKEDFSAPSELTQHPTEDGPEFADHIILRSQTLRITGVISETPFSVKGQLAGIATVAGSQVGASIGGSIGGGSIVGRAIGSAAGGLAVSKTLAGVLAPPSVTLDRDLATGRERFRDVDDIESDVRRDTNLPGQNSRMRDAVNEFLLIRQARIAVNIVTGLKLYKDFVLTDFNPVREVVMGKSLQVNLTFQQLVFSNPADTLQFTPVERVAQKKLSLGQKGLNQLTGSLSNAAGNAFSKLG